MERLVDWSVRSLCKIYVYHGVQSSFHVHRDGGETKAEEAAKDVSHDAKMVAKRRDVEPIPNPSPPFFSPSPHLRAGGDHASPVRGEGDGHHGALMLPVLGQQRRGADVEDPRQAVGEPAGERALSAGRPVGVGRTRAVGAAPGALPRRVELVQLLPRGDVPHPDGAVLGHRGGLCVVSMPTFAPRQRHVAGGLHVYTTRVNASCARTLFLFFFVLHTHTIHQCGQEGETQRERGTQSQTHTNIDAYLVVLGISGDAVHGGVVRAEERAVGVGGDVQRPERTRGGGGDDLQAVGGYRRRSHRSLVLRRDVATRFFSLFTFIFILLPTPASSHQALSSSNSTTRGYFVFAAHSSAIQQSRGGTKKKKLSNRRSRDGRNLVERPMLLTSRKKSEKSTGQTRRKRSSDAVTAKPSP